MGWGKVRVRKGKGMLVVCVCACVCVCVCVWRAFIIVIIILSSNPTKPLAFICVVETSPSLTLTQLQSSLTQPPSGYLGGALWSGDVKSLWEVMSIQFTAGLNAAMSGVIYWTTDIGGYAGGVCGVPDYDELITRWYQWGAFCPIFRTHGRRGHCENEIWEYGEGAYHAIKEVVLLRESLAGEVRSAWMTAARDGTPVMRPLFWDYPNPIPQPNTTILNSNPHPSPNPHPPSKPNATHASDIDPTGITFTLIPPTNQELDAHEVEDQMLFGGAFLVAPQFRRLSEGGGSRLVFLPALREGERWVDWWSNETLNSSMGQWVKVQTPLNRFGLFKRVRA